MSERDKEYYNQKIGELYSVIENQEKIIRDLQSKNVGLQTRIKTIIRRRKRETHYKKIYKVRLNKLQQRIDKAIEFIEKDKLGRSDIPALELILKIRKDKILNILKEGNNEKDRRSFK